LNLFRSENIALNDKEIIESADDCIIKGNLCQFMVTHDYI